MFLEARPLTEVPGFTRAQLDALARNVERRRQQLENGIEEYISSRQDELRCYEQEVTTLHSALDASSSRG